MEPRTAVLLIRENSILTACKLQIGVFIADNDSSSICAVRKASNHEVTKQSDKNYTTRGVVSSLYKIKKIHKELNSIAIAYLKNILHTV